MAIRYGTVRYSELTFVDMSEDVVFRKYSSLYGRQKFDAACAYAGAA